MFIYIYLFILGLLLGVQICKQCFIVTHKDMIDKQDYSVK